MSVTAPTFTPTARPDHRPGALGVARSEWTKIRSLRSTYWTLLVTAGLTIGLGLSYGPQAALYAEMFPAPIRYCGVAIGYALGAILGGAFAPTISHAILGASGKSWLIGLYLVGITIVSLVAVSLVKDRPGVDLHVPEHDRAG